MSDLKRYKAEPGQRQHAAGTPSRSEPKGISALMGDLINQSYQAASNVSTHSNNVAAASTAMPYGVVPMQGTQAPAMVNGAMMQADQALQAPQSPQLSNAQVASSAQVPASKLINSAPPVYSAHMAFPANQMAHFGQGNQATPASPINVVGQVGQGNSANQANQATPTSLVDAAGQVGQGNSANQANQVTTTSLVDAAGQVGQGNLANQANQASPASPINVVGQTKSPDPTLANAALGGIDSFALGSDMTLRPYSDDREDANAPMHASMVPPASSSSSASASVSTSSFTASSYQISQADLNVIENVEPLRMPSDRQREGELQAPRGSEISAQSEPVQDSELDQSSVLAKLAQSRKGPRTTKQATGALDALLNMIQQHSGIDPDSIEVNPYEIYLMRRREVQEVNQEIQAKQDQHFANFANTQRAAAKVDPEICFSKIAFDALNHEAIKSGFDFLEKCFQRQRSYMYLLFGGYGSGKTTVCHAICNEFINRLILHRALSYDPQANVLTGSYDVHYNSAELCDFNDHPCAILITLEDVRRACFYTKQENFEERLERERRYRQMCNTELLFIDNLCSGFVALDTFSQRILGDLLKSRSEQRLPTVMTTNVSMQQFHQAVGTMVYEAIKNFEVFVAAAKGGSRRGDILYHGRSI